MYENQPEWQWRATARSPGESTRPNQGILALQLGFRASGSTPDNEASRFAWEMLSGLIASLQSPGTYFLTSDRIAREMTRMRAYKGLFYGDSMLSALPGQSIEWCAIGNNVATVSIADFSDRRLPDVVDRLLNSHVSFIACSPQPIRYSDLLAHVTASMQCEDSDAPRVFFDYAKLSSWAIPDALSIIRCFQYRELGDRVWWNVQIIGNDHAIELARQYLRSRIQNPSALRS